MEKDSQCKSVIGRTTRWYIFIFVLLIIGMVLEVDPQPVPDYEPKNDGRPKEEATWNNPKCLELIEKKYEKRN